MYLVSCLLIFRLLFFLLGFTGGIRCEPADVEALSLIYELPRVKYQGSIYPNRGSSLRMQADFLTL